MSTEYAKAKARLRAKTAHHKKKFQIMEHYGGAKCTDCDETDFYLLQLHHVNHNGKACRKEANVTTNSYTYWNWLIKHDYPAHHEQTVLCRNCHMKETLTTIEHGPPVRLKPRDYASLINPHDIPFNRQVKYAKYIRKDDPNFIPQYPEVVQRLRERAAEGKYAPYWHVKSLQKSGFDTRGLFKPEIGEKPTRIPGHCIPRKSRKAKQVRKKRTQHKRVALTDKAKLLIMFGMTEEDLKE